MEIPSSVTKNNQENRKMSIKMVGGGAIGGFILLGGALAAATFLGSAFAKSRKRRSNNHKPAQPLPPPESEKTDENDTRNGLTLVLPDSSKNESADVESASPLPTHNSVLEEKPNLQANGVFKELKFSHPIDESEISREEFPVLSKISPDFTKDVEDNKSCDEIEENLESGEAIEAEDSSNQIPIEVIRRDLVTLEKGCESDAEEESEEVIEETKLHTNENQEVEEECESGCNIIVKSDEEGFEGASVEMERQLIEDEEIICSIEASEVKPMQELFEDEKISCSIEESEVKPTQELSLQTTESVPENINKDEEEFQHMQTEEEQDLMRTDNQEAQHKDCLIEVFDHSPNVFEREDGNLNAEDGGVVLTEDSLEVKSDECVVAETSDLDEGCDEEFQVSEKQDNLVVEIIDQVDTKEEDFAEKIAEGNQLIRSDDEEENKHIAVNGNEQLQFGEQEDGKDEETADDDDEDTSDEGRDEEFQASEKQDNLVAEIIEQVDSKEEDSTEKFAEGNQLIRSDNEEEENKGNDDKHIAVNGNEQLQFSEQEDGKDEETADEDTSEKAEESAEGTGDSSMESNADAVWPVEKSTHEELTKYLLDDSKFINNNPTNEKNYLSKINLLQVRVWILLFLAPLLLLLLLVHIFKPSFYYAPL